MNLDLIIVMAQTIQIMVPTILTIPTIQIIQIIQIILIILTIQTMTTISTAGLIRIQKLSLGQALIYGTIFCGKLLEGREVKEGDLLYRLNQIKTY